MKLAGKVRDMRTIKTLLSGAEAEAQRARESLPGAEHLLLSAVALPDGSAPVTAPSSAALRGRADRAAAARSPSRS